MTTGSSGNDGGVKFWGMVARIYDEVVDRAIGKNLRPSALEKLSRERGLGRALELGCGTGYFTQALAGVSDSVVATDFSDEMLAKARERLKDVGNVTLQKEDCRKTSFPDDSFDTVFMALVLNYVPDPAAVLSEVRRILKPGGRAIIANLDNSFISEARKMLSAYKLMAGYGEAQARYPQTFRNLPLEDLGQLLGSSGLKLEGSELIRDEAGSIYDSTIDAMEYVKAVKATEDFDLLMAVVKAHGPHGSPENALEVKYLVKNYGKFTAVSGVSFSVKRGEVFALLGPNGAGKTTIVEILELLKAPTRGFISIFGNAVLSGVRTELGGNPYPGEGRNYRYIKERIGVLPQGFTSFELLTVYENIDYFARMYARHVDIARLMGELDLSDTRNRLFKDLSGGLKQRVGIAIALINDPDILFLDEPTTGLDPGSRRKIWEAVKALKARGKTIFLTTHYMDEAYHLADHVCVIHKGRIVAEGSPEDLINQFGGGNTLVVRECCDDALDPLAKALPGSTVEGNTVLARLPEGDGMASIEKAVGIIEAGGFSCREVYVKKPTLEDVFLNLTGEKLTEGL